MPLHQIGRRIERRDADKRRTERRGQTLRHADADSQAGKRTRPAVIDHRTQIGGGNACFGEQPADLRQDEVGLFVAGIGVARQDAAVGLQGEGKEGSACIDGQHGAGEIGLHGGFAGCLVGRHYSILPPPFFFQTASPSSSYPPRPLYTEPFSGSLPAVSQPGR